jgi:hypothetical protein
MKHNLMLTITSLLSILFFTFHLADDIVRGYEKGGVSNLTALPIFVVWMYGTLVLGDRRSGHVIMLLGALLSLAVPVLHMTGKGVGVGGPIAKSQRSLLLRLDAHRDRRDVAILRHPLRARPVEPAAGPVPVVPLDVRRREAQVGPDGFPGGRFELHCRNESPLATGCPESDVSIRFWSDVAACIGRATRRAMYRNVPSGGAFDETP